MIKHHLLLSSGWLAAFALSFSAGTGSHAQILGNQPDPNRTANYICGGCGEENAACSGGANSNCCGATNNPPALVCSPVANNTCQPPADNGMSCANPWECASGNCASNTCEPTSCSCAEGCYDNATNMSSQVVCASSDPNSSTGTCVGTLAITLGGMSQLNCDTVFNDPPGDPGCDVCDPTDTACYDYWTCYYDQEEWWLWGWGSNMRTPFSFPWIPTGLTLASSLQQDGASV
jgi:hypothetical protein